MEFLLNARLLIHRPTEDFFIAGNLFPRKRHKSLSDGDVKSKLAGLIPIFYLFRRVEQLIIAN